EMSGNPMAIQQGFKALRAGGRASLLGIPTENVPLDLVNDVIFKGATVQGIYGRRMYETWVQMTSLLKAGRLNLEPLFGERAPLDKFENAFTLLQGGMAGKILLYPNGMPRSADRLSRFRICFAANRPLTHNSYPPGRVQVRSANMSDTATITSRQNPLQYVTDELKELRGKGVAPRLRVLEGEQKPVCIFDGKEVINLA